MYVLTTRCASVSEHPPRHPSQASLPGTTLLLAPCSYSAGRPSTHGLFWLLTAVGGRLGWLHSGARVIIKIGQPDDAATRSRRSKAVRRRR